MKRWIMHVDMDAFYASIEQMDNPDLAGRPVIVGGGTRGVVSACSYEARAFGVRSAMPLFQARRLCPQAVCTPVRMARYAEVSRMVQAVLHDISPRVEQASIDEAYLDITGLERLFGPPETVGRTVKAKVTAATGGLKCSVGLAPVKFLAKIASDINKPDGLFILPAADVPTFLHTLAVGDIPGVGKTFLAQLANLGVHTCAHVIVRPLSFWERRFGKSGITLFERANGIDPREVEPVSAPKSESAESTFEHNTTDTTLLRDWLFRHADRVGRSLRRQHLSGRVVTLKIKYADFQQLTRQTTLPAATCATETIFETGCALLDTVHLAGPVRLIGLGVSNFGSVPQQLLLPISPEAQRQEDEERRNRLDSVLDALDGKVVRGRLLKHPKG